MPRGCVTTLESAINMDVVSRGFSRENGVSRRIRELIESTKMPEEVEKEIKEAYRKLCEQEGEEVYVAVRSSATAEDLPEASFAGQQDTYLNVRGEDAVVEKVRKCWGSLFTPRAIYYRVQKGFKHEEVSIAVVVQKMINSEKSGVCLLYTSPSPRDRG